MDLCSFMRRAELLAQQPVLSGAVVFGACVCGRVTTRLVQTFAVTIREPVGSIRRPWSGYIKISAGGHVHTKQDYLWAKQLVRPLLILNLTVVLVTAHKRARSILITAVT